MCLADTMVCDYWCNLINHDQKVTYVDMLIKYVGSKNVSLVSKQLECLYRSKQTNKKQNEKDN